jgi:glycosyltransferase involved in cell wall biosynthesis
VVRELSRRIEVHVFALRHPERRRRYHVHGAEVHALGGGVLTGVRRVGLLGAAWTSIIAEHRRAPFDALHGVWADEPGFVAVAAGRRLRLPVIVSVMGGELVALRDIGYGGRRARSNRLLAGVALTTATRVTVGSRATAALAWQGMRTSRRSRLARMPWGVDPGLFRLCGASLDLGGRPRLLHVGSLVAVKDQKVLLRAAARVKATDPNVHLHMVGDGPLRSTLMREANSLGLEYSITFHGHVERHHLARYYRAADIVVVSSRHEAQLVVSLEAALCGVPVVGTAVGLVSDFSPTAAISVPVGDDRGLAEAITLALRPESRAALGAAALRIVRSDYLAAHTADRLVSMYRNPATGPKP